MEITKKMTILSQMAEAMSEISGVKLQGFFLSSEQAEVIAEGLKKTQNRNKQDIYVTYICGFRIQTKDPNSVVTGAYVRWYDIEMEDGRPSTFWGID